MDLLKKDRYLLCIDNINSSAKKIPQSAQGQYGNGLKQFVNKVRATQTYVALASRSSEEWLLDKSDESTWILHGLDLEAGNRLAVHILQQHEITVERLISDPYTATYFDQLLHVLQMHPAAIKKIVL